MKCPVIAVRSGGPLETIAHGETGFLCEPTAKSFAAAMMKFVENVDLAEKLGNAGYERVMKKFSFVAFTSQLDKIAGDLCQN